MVAGADWFGDLGSMAASLKSGAQPPWFSGHLVLVPLPVPHGALLGLLQGCLRALTRSMVALRRSPAWVTHSGGRHYLEPAVYAPLLTDLDCSLRMNFLFLREAATGVLVLLSSRRLLHPGLQILDKQLSQVVEGLQLLGDRLLEDPWRSWRACSRRSLSEQSSPGVGVTSPIFLLLQLLGHAGVARWRG